MKKNKILVVDDDAGHLLTVKTIVKSWGHHVVTADDGSTAVARAKNEPVDLIVMDVRMVEMNGLEALKKIKAYNPAIPIIIITAYSSVDTAVEALKSGAYDYLTKPLDFDLLKLTIERAREHAGLKHENRQLKAKLAEGLSRDNIIGKSPSMQRLLETMAMVAPSDATVLITGDSGTGKELIARSIHMSSPRSHADLVIVNCAAISETLLESELFGHEKGAFTGADRQRSGRFKQADGGTIFLDEIGETSPAMQAKLLRVIQEREIQPVGSSRVEKVDVRIVAATNRDLSEEVEKGNFREDLFYRINVVTLQIPPLRKRMEDIPLLADAFVRRYAEKNRKVVKGFTPLAMNYLLNHDWPGNVRELENAVERAVILMTGDHITENQLPINITGKDLSSDTAMLGEGVQNIPADQPLEEIEKRAIIATLKSTGGNKSETARRLGINRKTLHNKLKRYGLE
jgi:two-component system response regulator HydG